MRTRAAIAVVVALAAAGPGCQDTPIPSQHVELGRLSFEVPADWRRHDGWRDGALTASWTPPTNERKESVTVIRASHPDRRPAASILATIQQQLVSAQASLRGARIGRVQPLTTDKGLAGARLDVGFQPNGIEQRYRRVHVVLIEDAATLVHVLYTAADPRPDQDVVQLVLDTLKAGAS